MLYVCKRNESRSQREEDEFTGSSSVERHIVFLETIIAKGQSKVSLQISFADQREARKFSVGKTYDIPIPLS